MAAVGGSDRELERGSGGRKGGSKRKVSSLCTQCCVLVLCA